MTNAAPRMGGLEWLLLILLSVLWGGSFFFGKVALAELPPFSVAFGRVGLAMAALLLAVRMAGLHMPARARDWRPFFALGLLNNVVPFSLIMWGQTQIASGLAAILNANTPLFTVLLAHVLTRDERLSANRLAGVLAGMAGVAVMIGPAALGGLGRDVAGQVAILGAAASYALAGIYGRRFRGTPPLVTAVGQVSASAVMLLPAVLLVDRPWLGPVPGAVTLGAVAALALLGTAVAYILYFRILATAGATNAVLVTFLVPVSALLLGTGILGEVIEPRQFLGMALIGVGLAAIDGRAVAALRRLRPARPRPSPGAGASDTA